MPLKPLKRLPLTKRTKDKISASKTGKPLSAEHKRKISETLSGRKHSPERIENIKQGLKRNPRPRTNEEIIRAGRRETMKRRRRETKVRLIRWRLDIAKAMELGDLELRKDIIRSGGWRSKRTMHHPEVSEGYVMEMHRMDREVVRELAALRKRLVGQARQAYWIKRWKKEGKL